MFRPLHFNLSFSVKQRFSVCIRIIEKYLHWLKHWSMVHVQKESPQRHNTAKQTWLNYSWFDLFLQFKSPWIISIRVRNQTKYIVWHWESLSRLIMFNQDVWYLCLNWSSVPVPINPFIFQAFFHEEVEQLLLFFTHLPNAFHFSQSTLVWSWITIKKCLHQKEREEKVLKHEYNFIPRCTKTQTLVLLMWILCSYSLHGVLEISWKY